MTKGDEVRNGTGVFVAWVECYEKYAYDVHDEAVMDMMGMDWEW
jgi:hypothetical protein